MASKLRWLATVGAFLASMSSLRADERLKGVACRSVHLQYVGDEAVQFYLEIKIIESAPGSYFAVCGWQGGYFGLQELANGKKVAIFSVWDSGQNDRDAVPEEQRVKVLDHDPDVRIGRFGGEGTGGQSFFDFPWEIGRTYRFLVRAKPDDRRTVYTGFIFMPKEKEWKRLVSFSTLADGRDLRGMYSFVEDFRRNRISTKQPRQAEYGNVWSQSKAGDWRPIVAARFTADGNPAMNIDAGARDDWFYLATGGDLENAGTKLWETIRIAPSRQEPPDDLPASVTN